MRLLKTLGIAAIVAAGVVATTGSASATSLCLKVEDPCAKSNIKSELKISSTNTVLSTSTLTEECAMHLVNNLVLSGTFWDTNDLLLLDFTKCGVCTVVTGATTYELGPTGSGNGVFKGSATLSLSECPFGQKCTYKAEGEKLVTLLGSETNAKLEMAMKMLLVEGSAALCGEEGTLKGTFTGVSETDKMTSVSKSP